MKETTSFIINYKKQQEDKFNLFKQEYYNSIKNRIISNFQHFEAMTKYYSYDDFFNNVCSYLIEDQVHLNPQIDHDKIDFYELTNSIAEDLFSDLKNIKGDDQIIEENVLDKGSIALTELKDSFKNMTVEEYQELYEKASGFVSVDVELSDSVILQLALIAHKRNLTMNQLCNDILRECIEKVNK
jgi:hypothetical protein